MLEFIFNEDAVPRHRFFQKMSEKSLQNIYGLSVKISWFCKANVVINWQMFNENI